MVGNIFNEKFLKQFLPAVHQSCVMEKHQKNITMLAKGQPKVPSGIFSLVRRVGNESMNGKKKIARSHSQVTLQPISLIPSKELHSIEGQDELMLDLENVQEEPPVLKDYERDLIGNTSIYAFIPLLKLVAPSFTSNVIQCSDFIASLSQKEQQVMQQVVDMALKRVEIEANRNTNTIFELLLFLFCLHGAMGDFVQFKKKLLKEFINMVAVENVLSVLEAMDVYLERVELMRLGEKIEQQPNLLQTARDYCLDFIKHNVYEDEFDIKLNPRVSKYVMQFYNRKPKKYVVWNESEYRVPVNVMELLFSDTSTSDIRIAMDQGRFLCVHKTVLSSSSLFFEALFSNSGTEFSDIHDGVFYPNINVNLRALEHIVAYCYGLFRTSQVQPKEIVSMIEMAHEHDMSGLIQMCCPSLYQNLDIDSFLRIALWSTRFLNSSKFERVIDAIIKFGVKNCRKLFEKFGKDDLSKCPYIITSMFFEFLAQQTIDNSMQ